MRYYKLIKVTIDTLDLAKVIIDVVVCHYEIPVSIVTDWDLLFILKFWPLLYYFLRIQKKLSTAFYLQIDGQSKKQNNIMGIYLRAFVNWE